ncbi:MAG: tetraacyldisaccharide 4'-kinase [Thermodesulfobacteriota bacterium]
MPKKFSSLYFLGRPFSPLYSGLMRARETMYLKGIKQRHKLGVPVISIGNLTMGGTGKTPVVAHLASMLQEKGLRPAIISRGYGGAAGNKVNVVSDSSQILMNAKDAGDEPRLLAESLPGIPVLTGIVRILPCRHGVQELGCNIIILDDGFQHLAVDRDLDIVLFSAASLAGNSRVFPGGDLREPISALKRCHAFIITGVTGPLEERSMRFKELLQQRFPDKPVFFSSYQPAGARSSGGDTLEKLSELPTPLFAFCGIAQPELFRKSLEAENIVLSGFMPLKDHQPFSPSLIKKISSQAEKSGAKGLITTEKDLVKLPKESFSLPCFGLTMAVHPDNELSHFLEEKVSFFTRLCHSSHRETS